jgi:hypothetical protein
MVDRGTIARGLPGYGLKGYEFRYPKASAYRTKEGLSDEYFQKWAEAYAKNKITAFSNSWVRFLKSKGFYDRMKKELAMLSDEYHKAFPKRVKTAAEYKRIGPVILRQRKRVKRMERAIELLQDPSIKEYARKLYDKWLQKKDKLAQLGVLEITIEKLEEEAKADIAKELGKVREKLTFYESIAESPEYEEAPIVRTGVRRKPYRALKTALAQDLGVPVPKSAKTSGRHGRKSTKSY